MKIQDIGNRGEDIGGWRRYESENENESGDRINGIDTGIKNYSRLTCGPR